MKPFCVLWEKNMLETCEIFKRSSDTWEMGEESAESFKFLVDI